MWSFVLSHLPHRSLQRKLILWTQAVSWLIWTTNHNEPYVWLFDLKRDKEEKAKSKTKDERLWKCEIRKEDLDIGFEWIKMYEKKNNNIK